MTTMSSGSTNSCPGIGRRRFGSPPERPTSRECPARGPYRTVTKYQASVEEMFKSLRTEALSIDSIKPSVVFDAYARRTGLFGDDAKKDQFPDAFIFEVLKAVAKQSDPLTIVSDDKDFAAVIEDADHISRLKSIPDLFADLGLTIEAAPDVEDFVE